MACDLISMSTPRRTVNEQTTMVVHARFRNRASAADVTPTTVAYRVDDLSIGLQLVDWTTVTPASSVDITITSTANKIQNDFRQYEAKQITVKTNSGLTDQFIESFTWDVKNLTGIH